MWLGITNCFVRLLLASPTQQLNQPGPTIEAALPCAYTSYGFGCVSSVVLLAREAAVKKFLYAVRPAIERGEESEPFHLPLTCVAILPPKSYTKLIAKYQSVPAM